MRKSIRSLFGEIEKDYPHLKETLLSAMGNLEPSRLLDPRYLDLGRAGRAGAAADLGRLDQRSHDSKPEPPLGGGHLFHLQDFARQHADDRAVAFVQPSPSFPREPRDPCG